MNLKLQNIGLPAYDFEQTVYFYRDVLALRVLHEGPGFCTLETGGASLSIHPVNPDGQLDPTGHGLYLEFTIESLPAAFERFRRTGVVLQKEWEDEAGRYALVSDPNGNRIQLVERAAS